MAIVCSTCESPPQGGAVAGASCHACGAPLIQVDTRDELVGTTLDGRFEVLAPLGKGGMGIVYRAKQLSIGREVALKVLDRRIEGDVAAVKRFFREAKIASTLAHPNTVPIVDFGQASTGRLYLVMELIKGRTLHAELVRVGAMQLSRVIAIGTQLCDALDVAHGMSIVHRDLKLENVMLLDTGRDHVKILDFGLARVLTDPSTQMTATGLISGTPHYMPPEVALDGAPPAAPQDLYSVGVILAELAIGRALWAQPTLEALFLAKQHTERAIADVPAQLKPLVRALLADDPGARPTASGTREMLRMIGAPAPATRDLEPAPAAAGTGARFERARSPLALDPTEAGFAPADPFANLALVALDERDAPPRPAPPPAPPAQVTGDPFAAPPDAPMRLEIDPEDQPPKTGTMADHVVRTKAKPIWLVVALLVVLGVGAGAYFLYIREPAKRPREIDGAGITIEIKAHPPARVTIDGKAAGTTPLSLKVPKGTKPIMIGGEGLAPQQVIPDRDQEIRMQNSR